MFYQAGRMVLAFVIAGAGFCAQAQESAQWPNKPVKILLGFPPGGSTDVGARLIAAGLERALGQPFVVENRPGAGGTIVIDQAARAGTDGYTVLYTSTGPFAVGPHVYKELKSKPLTDFIPVVMVGRAPLLLVVAADSPYQTLADVIKAGKDPSKQLNYGSDGATNYFAMELFKNRTGANYLHVRYKGAPAALADLLGGRLQLLFESPGSIMPLIKDGKLRVLATGGAQPYSETPGVPTIAASYPGFEVGTWTAFVFPAGTPEAIVQKLNAAVIPLLNDPELAQRSKSAGVELFEANTSAQAKARIEQDFNLWSEAVKEAGLSAN
jgi:tripartite-type tricarboxylate transporter receptor subunit TctC